MGSDQPRRVRPLASLTRAVCALLAANIVVAGWIVAETLHARDVLAALRDGRSIDADQVDRIADRLSVGAVVSVVALVATAIVFVVWFARAYGNVEALGSQPRYSRRWAVIGWIVPIWSLFRPKQVLDDIWGATEPWQRIRGPASSGLTNAWWATFLIANVAARLVPDDFDIDRAPTAMTIAVAAEVLLVLAAVLAILVVLSVDRRQAARVRSMDAPEDTVPEIAVLPRFAGGGTFAFALVALVVGGVLGTQRDVAIDPDGVGRVTNADFQALPLTNPVLVNGSCLAASSITADGRIVDDTGVRCTEPHRFEVLRDLGVEGSSYPGDGPMAELAESHCWNAFLAETGRSLLAFGDGFDVLIFSPERAAWAAGDRRVVCVAEVPGTTSVQLRDIDRKAVAGGYGSRSTFTLMPGDCLAPAADLSQQDVPVVACDSPHRFEVVHEALLDAGPFPGDDAAFQAGERLCLDTLRQLGLSLEDERIAELWPLTPTDASWRLGDRVVSCVVERTGEPLDVLVAGARGGT